MLLIKKEFVASDFHFIPDNCFFSFKSLFTSAWFPYDGAIVPVVSNNVQIIGTIIWKHYPDDRKRPGRLSTTSIALKYQVYISLRSSHDWQGEKYKWVYLACPTRLTLHPSLRPTPQRSARRERESFALSLVEGYGEETEDTLDFLLHTHHCPVLEDGWENGEL